MLAGLARFNISIPFLSQIVLPVRENHTPAALLVSISERPGDGWVAIPTRV